MKISVLSSTGSLKYYNDFTGTGTIAASRLGVMTGDSGSGGAKGAVPAPAAGDYAAGKYLDAGANWSVPPGLGLTQAQVLARVSLRV